MHEICKILQPVKISQFTVALLQVTFKNWRKGAGSFQAIWFSWLQLSNKERLWFVYHLTEHMDSLWLTDDRVTFVLAH